MLLVALALAGASGCGSDDEPATTTKAPELTVPKTSTEPTQATETAPATTTSPSTSTGGEGGGTTSPSGGQDSPGHDVPPERGTPEDRFERFCNQNPGACG